MRAILRSRTRLFLSRTKRAIRAVASDYSRSGQAPAQQSLPAHLRVRLGTLRLLRCSRLTLHLPLRILRGGRYVAGCAIHRRGRRMFLVGSHAGVVWPLPVDAGPEPASFRFAARPPVSQGPAIAVPALKTTTAQPARMSRFVFICFSFVPARAPRRSRTKENRSGGHRFRVARGISLLSNRARECLPANTPWTCEAIMRSLYMGTVGALPCDLRRAAGRCTGQFAA